MGMGIGAAGAFGSVTQQVFAPANSGLSSQQPSNPTQAAPAAPAGSTDDPMEVLSKLKRMLDAGLIEQAEYDAKKAEILSRL